MALPLIAALGPTFLGALLSARKTKQPDLLQIIQQMLPFLSEQLAPGRTAMINAGISRGQALGQDISGALGRIGGAATGPGRIAMSLGQSLSSGLVGEAEATHRQNLMQLVAQLAPTQAGLKAGERSGTENLMSFLAQALSGGQLSGQLSGLGKQRRRTGGSTFFAPSVTNPGGFP